MKKKYVIRILFYLSLVIVLCTCNDPIFYMISQEVAPIEPRIKGSPTNFAVYGGNMYVASGRNLYSYKDGSWDKQNSPGGIIRQVAATTTSLYVLCAPNNELSTVIWSYNGTLWSPQAGPRIIQSIFVAGNTLFAYEGSGPYTILYLSGSGLTQLETTKGYLTGVAYDGTNYYLSTYGSGVYKVNSSFTTTTHIESNIEFTGIINLGVSPSKIFLIDRKGNGYYVDSSITSAGVSLDKMSSGALAIWKGSATTTPPAPGQNLLLAGRQADLSYSYSYGFSYGYLEVELGAAGIIGNFIEPGKTSLSSINTGENERFQSTIGRNPVKYLFQAPDGILFASTQQKGVHSYRNRGGTFQWNAEE
jgi:hypothetical protein